MSSQFRLLYAEDDADDLELFQKAVLQSSLPIEVSFARDGIDLEKQISNDVIADLILLDVHLPFFDALEFVGRLRSNKLYEQVPLIIYSSYPLHRFLKKCIEAGANSYLVKPDNFTTIVETVEKIYFKTYHHNTFKGGFAGSTLKKDRFYL
jgi:CheY-like chemotaxis protein